MTPVRPCKMARRILSKDGLIMRAMDAQENIFSGAMVNTPEIPGGYCNNHPPLLYKRLILYKALL